VAPQAACVAVGPSGHQAGALAVHVSAGAAEDLAFERVHAAGEFDGPLALVENARGSLDELLAGSAKDEVLAQFSRRVLVNFEQFTRKHGEEAYETSLVPQDVKCAAQNIGDALRDVVWLFWKFKNDKFTQASDNIAKAMQSFIDIAAEDPHAPKDLIHQWKADLQSFDRRDKWQDLPMLWRSWHIKVGQGQLKTGTKSLLQKIELEKAKREHIELKNLKLEKFEPKAVGPVSTIASKKTAKMRQKRIVKQSPRFVTRNSHDPKAVGPVGRKKIAEARERIANNLQRFIDHGTSYDPKDLRLRPPTYPGSHSALHLARQAVREHQLDFAAELPMIRKYVLANRIKNSNRMRQAKLVSNGPASAISDKVRLARTLASVCKVVLDGTELTTTWDRAFRKAFSASFAWMDAPSQEIRNEVSKVIRRTASEVNAVQLALKDVSDLAVSLGRPPHDTLARWSGRWSSRSPMEQLWDHLQQAAQRMSALPLMEKFDGELEDLMLAKRVANAKYSEPKAVYTFP